MLCVKELKKGEISVFRRKCGERNMEHGKKQWGGRVGQKGYEAKYAASS